jgi:hypothetical protein
VKAWCTLCTDQGEGTMNSTEKSERHPDTHPESNPEIELTSETIGKDFKPKLRNDIEIRFFKSDERGDFYLVRNPTNKRYVKVHESGKEFMEYLDGSFTMDELHKKTDVDIYNFVKILARGGYLTNIKEEKKEEPFYTIKIPIFRSNHKIFLKMYEFFSFVGSTWFKIFYAFFVGLAGVLFVWYLPEIFEHVLLNFDLTVSLRPIFVFMLIFYVVELAHEFAHTGASYNYGAEPGDVGIVFHFLVAFFYVETPDTRILTKEQSIGTFIAGPLTSLFAAAICIYVFVFTDYMPIVWATSAFFWVMSTLITLSPFMQTDGYYIIQEIYKFPNLFQHATSYLSLNIFRLFGKVKKEEYQKALEGFTERERGLMKKLALFIPFQVGILAFFFFYMATKINIVHILQLAPVILTENPWGIKGYFLLFFLSFGIFMSAFAASLTAYRFFKQGPKTKW